VRHSSNPVQTSRSMSLVVVVADADVPDGLFQHLHSLGYETLHAASPQLAADLCRRQQAALVVACSQAAAQFVASEQPRIPTVLLSSDPLDKATLLKLMRAGVADVWEGAPDAQLIGQRVVMLRHRSEAQVVQAERELSQHLADLERDQRAGRFIQMGMLPPNPLQVDQFKFEHKVQPSLFLSGDFVDYFRITDRYFGCYVADVSGHGASSAFVTVLLKNFSRRLRREFQPSMLDNPGEVLTWLNRELLDQNMEKHVTLFFAIGDLQLNSLRFVNGGHYPPPILVNDAGASLLEQSGKPVGLFEDVAYTHRDVEFNVGDRLVVFSDGVFEIMNGADLSANEEHLLALAAAQPDLNGLWNRLVGSQDHANPDDMTCLMVSREA